MTAWYSYPITHGYYPKYLSDVFDTPHQAIDLAMPQDTPITAFKPGQVVQADYAIWNGQPGGGEVFIKPDDGSTEYYFYHLDNIEVKKGQHLNLGQEVGLSGGQNSGGSHPTSPMWSTGPHLHVAYFTGWENTPVGTRSVGPDITPTIKFLASGGGYTATPTQAASAANGPGGINQQGIAIAGKRAAIFFVAVVLIIGGFYLAFQTQIDKGIKTAAKVALV